MRTILSPRAVLFPELRSYILPSLAVLALLALAACGGGTGETVATPVARELPVTDLLTTATSRMLTPTDFETVTLKDGFVVDAARDEVLVSLKPDVTSDEIRVIADTIEQHGGKIVGDDPHLRLLQVHVSPGVSEQDFSDLLEFVPGVLDAYVNITVDLDALPPGVPFPDGFDGSYWIDQIRARQAWSINTGDPAIPIGIVDAGMNHAVNALDPARVDVVDPEGVPIAGNTDDFTLHGTTSAALIAGDGLRLDNSVGVAWLNRLTHVDAFDPTFPAKTYVSEIMAGIERTIEAGARIVNLGVGPTPLLPQNPGTELNFIIQRLLFRDAISPAVQYARRHNALLVFSAGNDGDGSDENHPLILDFNGHPVTPIDNDNFFVSGAAESRGSWEYNALIAGATPDGADMARFSRQGAVVEIAAPGQAVSFGGVPPQSGTSFSAALTSGAAALMLSTNPTLSGAEVKQTLKLTADQAALPEATINGGRLDVGDAVAAARFVLSLPYQPDLDVQFAESGKQARELFRTVEIRVPSIWGHVEGVVTDDSIPPNPIEGAWVGLDGGPSVRTDFLGRYEIRFVPIPPAIRTIVCTAPDFFSESRTTVLTINETVIENFDLVPIPPPVTGNRPEVMWTIDASGSMSEEIETLRQRIDLFLGDLDFFFPGIRIGVGVYGSFPEYFLLQPLTRDTAAVSNAVKSILILGGLEIALDGLYQATTGAGWDGNGDGDVLDSGVDILPSNPGWSPGEPKFIILAADEEGQDADDDASHKGIGFDQSTDAVLAAGISTIILDGSGADGGLPQFQRIVEKVGGDIFPFSADGTDFLNAILNGLGQTIGGSGAIAGTVRDELGNPIAGAIVSINTRPLEITDEFGMYRVDFLRPRVGYSVIVEAGGFATQIRAPFTAIVDRVTTADFVLRPADLPPPPQPLRLLSVGDVETFLDPASPSLVLNRLPGDLETFVFRFQNVLNKPIHDLHYEFRIHAIYGDLLIERVPVSVFVPGSSVPTP